MGDATVVAESLRYPRPGRLEELASSVVGMSGPTARRAMSRFVEEIGSLDHAAWEELHTETLDLSPKVVPYVGHAVWGENYRRGAFMADLARAQSAAGIDSGGELPDHLRPVLRYLDATDSPLVDLVEVLPTALMRMTSELRKADSTNPYLHVLEAARAAADERTHTLRRASG